MKNAQVSQSFTFMAATIVIGILLLFGGYSVIQLMDNVQTIEDTQFRQNIEKRIDSVSSKYGSVEIFELTNLNEYTKVCVFDLAGFEASGNSISDFSEISGYSLMGGEVTDKTANFFLLGIEDVQERFLNEKIIVSDPFYTCQEIGSQGVVKIKLEGLGRTTKFSFIEP